MLLLVRSKVDSPSPSPSPSACCCSLEPDPLRTCPGVCIVSESNGTADEEDAMEKGMLSLTGCLPGDEGTKGACDEGASQSAWFRA